MILVVCLDACDGLRFNNRRQSRDRCVTERIKQLSEGKRLYISDSSKDLFADFDCIVASNFLELAEPGDICFCETPIVCEFIENVEKLIVFRWDKVYPQDEKFPLNEFTAALPLKNTSTFQGYSHELITQEIYER